MLRSDRARADACPGVFAPHDAADGALARVRLPGGALDRPQLRAIADCADDLGDGAVHLTSRGNVQLRGLRRDDPELVRRLRAAGLLPSATHERVRNILASPASGLTGGLVDVRGMVAELDAAVCAAPELAALPGRFCFALDDGRGDVTGDVGWRALDGVSGAIVLSDVDTGVRVTADDAVPALLRAAVAFLTVRGPAWRVRELADVTPVVAAAGPVSVVPQPMPVAPGFPLGEFPGGVCVAPVLGRVPSGMLRAFAELTARVVLTPWRSVLLAGVPAAAVRDVLGLLADPDAAGSGVSACAGRPGCARSLADVRADATRVLPVLPARVRAHFAGCERRCGRPPGAHDVLADGHQYLVDGARVPIAKLSDVLAGKDDPCSTI